MIALNSRNLMGRCLEQQFGKSIGDDLAEVLEGNLLTWSD